MISSIVQVFVSLVILVFGGEALVRGASALALRLGVSPLAVGLTVVAFGTSAPELVVSLEAALSGSSDIAIGNVVGSNIANIALILGLAAVIQPIATDWKIVRIDAPIMVAVVIMMALMLLGGEVSRIEGGLLITALIAFVGWTWKQAKNDKDSAPPALTDAVRTTKSLVSSIALVAGGLVGLIVGGQWLVMGAIDLAEMFGLSEATIGLTIVAVGTSLPELVTSLIAAARKQGGIALGNVVGSNIFNILAILGITSCLTPIGMGDITWLDIGIMGGLSLFLIPLLATGRSLVRWEGVILVVVYGVYVSHLIGSSSP